MRSTFMGLETSKRGLYTQQSALYTIGHNVSNANTLGYSRQRVNMQTTQGYPGIGLNAGTAPGFIGTGVEAHSVQRMRDQFIDRQLRQETNQLGYWDSKSQAITQMEDVMSEPSKFGLNESLDLFWKSLGDLGTSPENAGTRKVVIERGIAAAESFNYMNKQLVEIQGNLKNEIDVSTKDVNSILKQIAELNKAIQKVEPNGHMPNDLYDARDVLLDELSGYFPIEISYRKTGGNSLDIAEGVVDVSIKTKNGSIPLVYGKEASQLNHNMSGTPGNLDPFQNFTVVGGPGAGKTIGHDDLVPGKGKMLSTITSYGYGTEGKGDYPVMLAELDKMAQEFAKAFNEVHSEGYGLQTKDANGNKVDSEKGHNFFVDPDGLIAIPPNTNYGNTITAANIKVNQKIIDDPNKLASSSAKNQEGNGENALKLAGVKTTSLGGLEGATVQSFYQSLIGKLGVDGEQANRLAETSATKLGTIANSRASVSSVSLDEELTNMIIFQQSYNASARMITVVDETLDKIINGMGRVGL